MHNHAGYISIVVNASFFSAVRVPFNRKPLTDKWFDENDSEEIISSILFVSLNLPAGTINAENVYEASLSIYI